jgi:hypothetical protein
MNENEAELLIQGIDILNAEHWPAIAKIIAPKIGSGAALPPEEFYGRISDVYLLLMGVLLED